MSSLHKAVEGSGHGSGPTPMEVGLSNKISNGLKLDLVFFPRLILMYINTMGSAFTQDNPVCSQHFINLFFNVPPEWWLHLQKVCHCHSKIIWSNGWVWSWVCHLRHHLPSAHIACGTDHTWLTILVCKGSYSLCEPILIQQIKHSPSTYMI